MLLAVRIVSSQAFFLLTLLGNSPFKHDDSRSDERRYFFTSFAQKDPEAAALWLDRQIDNGSLTTTILDPLRNPRFDLEGALLGQLFRNNPDAAKERIATFNAEEREQIFDNPYQWLRGGKLPDDFLSLVRESLDEEKSTATIARSWANGGFDRIARSLKEIPFSQKERTAIVDEIMRSYLSGDPAEERHARAYTWLKEIAPSQAVSSIVGSLNHDARSGPSIEIAFQKSRELSQSLDEPEITNEFVRQFTARNPGAIDDPLNSFKDPALAQQIRDIFHTLPESSK